MDYLLPSETEMSLMRAEFEEILRSKQVGVLSYINNDAALACVRRRPCSLLSLYFICRILYNNVYGTQIYDTDGGLGEFRRKSTVFGNLNGLYKHD